MGVAELSSFCLLISYNLYRLCAVTGVCEYASELSKNLKARYARTPPSPPPSPPVRPHPCALTLAPAHINLADSGPGPTAAQLEWTVCRICIGTFLPLYYTEVVALYALL